jgi:predicted RNase H-like HicB family nuclease
VVSYRFDTHANNKAGSMLQIEFDRETDGRWLAEIPVLPGVMAYGTDKAEARARVEALALRVLADRLEHGENVPELGELFAAA